MNFMNNVVLLLLLLFIFMSVISALQLHHSDELKTDDSLSYRDEIREFDIFLQNLNPNSDTKSTKPGKSSDKAIIKINWRNCGNTNDPVLFNNISLSPNPFFMPGQVSFSFDMQVMKNITAPIKLKVEMKKKLKILGISTWVTVPCFKDILGSCTIDDICNKKNFTMCPFEMEGNEASCNCPIIQGSYSFPSLTQLIPALPSTINSNLMEGTYRTKFIAYKKQEKLLCFEATADISF